MARCRLVREEAGMQLKPGVSSGGLAQRSPSSWGRSSRACIICEAGSAAAALSIRGSEGWLRGEHAVVHESQAGGGEQTCRGQQAMANRAPAYGRFCDEETPPPPPEIRP